MASTVLRWSTIRWPTNTYYGNEPILNRYLQQNFKSAGFDNIKQVIADCLTTQFNQPVPVDKINLVEHHIAHAASAYYPCGHDSALTLVIDALGDDASGMVLNCHGDEMEVLHRFDEKDSLGVFYLKVIKYMGYNLFDEYKAMGLAPYGDPSIYKDQFESFYQLLPDGRYQLFLDKIDSLQSILSPRKKHQPFNDIHKNIAASLQQTLENIVFHIVENFARQTGQRNLCMAGGVAHNSTLNGKLSSSGLFDDVFIQPAAHDAGCALGSAWYHAKQLQPQVKIPPLKDVYWGKQAQDDDILSCLEKWQDIISFSKMDNTCKQVAKLLADGKVIGWVQGRSEFGPRALGNRSILADPRPTQNKQRINYMIKEREGFRPFAPAVLSEQVERFFDTPKGQQHFPYMTHVFQVHQHAQNILGATTHVDGSSRVQTVDKEVNPKYWQLIAEFSHLTDVPVLLNTSFNNHAEPIVDSVEDAITCYLTTQLDLLVVGDYLIEKRQVTDDQWMQLNLTLPTHMRLNAEHGYTLQSNYHPYKTTEISANLYQLLQSQTSWQSITPVQDTVKELLKLWSNRLIKLSPTGEAQ